MSKQTIIHWFRHDLRLHDNPALHHATTEGKVLPVYIFDDTNGQDKPIGAATQWWLHHSLIELRNALRDHLYVFKGDPQKILLALAEEFSAKEVVWNRCYEPWQIKRDKSIKSKLEDAEVGTKSFNGSLLWEPWKVSKADGSPYKVFTPFYRKGCLNFDAPRIPMAKPRMHYEKKTPKQAISIDELDLVPKIPWYKEMEALWQPGEEGAFKRLEEFLDGPISNYKNARDVPSIAGTSRLSPYLHFGEISPNSIWHAVNQLPAAERDDKNVDHFLSELGWREFSYYLLYHFPDLPKENFQNKFDNFRWAHDESSLLAWQKGKTGVPIVDAGMRELWQTGYMHNRVRMIVGSYLVKNLLIDWRHGEAWFWDCLLDADLANNSASWQWVAGSGADAAPYFRIFNPITQGEKFDPEGEYVKQYCPELKKLGKKYLHKPWEADAETLQEAGIKLGDTYPKPLVDLKKTRQRALDRFSELKSAS